MSQQIDGLGFVPGNFSADPFDQHAVCDRSLDQANALAVIDAQPDTIIFRMREAQLPVEFMLVGEQQAKVNVVRFCGLLNGSHECGGHALSPLRFSDAEIDHAKDRRTLIADPNRPMLQSQLPDQGAIRIGQQPLLRHLFKEVPLFKVTRKAILEQV